MSDEKIHDRRANGRILVSFPVELTDISFVFRGTAIDLSPSGVGVKLAGAPPMVDTDLEIVLRPPGEAPVKVKGRVTHGRAGTAGIAFAVGDMAVFEAGLNLYESLLMRDPKLAIALKKRPTSLSLSQRMWPMRLGTATLTGPEHWVYSKLLMSGVTIAELRQSIGAEWAHMAWVPFMLLERNLAVLSQPGEQIEHDVGRPVQRTSGSFPPAAPRTQSGSRPAVQPPPGRKPSGTGWPKI